MAMEDPYNEGFLPKDVLAELFKMKLRENPCRNRGFVLDGWPWT
jgi:hypothetical protein